MRQSSPWLVTLFAILALASAPAVGLAQSPHTYSVGLMAGLGGTFEDTPDFGFDNFGWQAFFTMKIETSTRWGVRAGELGLDAGALEADLRYVTLSGEYLFADRWFESGLYIGLGAYDVDAPLLGDDSSLGLVVGVTADFALAGRFSLLLELSGHYADLDAAQIFVMGHGGVAYRF